MDIIELVKTASLAKIQQLHRDGHLGKDPQTDFMVLRTTLTFNKTDIAEFLISSNCGVPSTAEFRMPDTSVDTPLHRAARLGDWTTMQKLLINEVPTSTDAMGNTALHLAFLHKREFIVDQILELLTVKKRFANLKNKLGLSYLHIACSRGNKEAIEGFLQTGSAADLISQDSFEWAGNNALHFAAIYGSEPALQALTALPDWRTTLDIENAAGKIPSRMIRAQVQKKLALDSIVSHPMRFRWECKQPNSVKSPVDDYAVVYLDSEASVLQWAVIDQRLDNVKAIIDRGVDTLTNDWEDMTPLHRAMYHRNEAIIDVLYEATNFEKRNATGDKNGLNFFHVACSRNDMETAKWLLNNDKRQLDAQVLYDRRLYSRYTALHFAVRYGHLQMVEWLIEAKADVNLGADGIDGTPLHLAFAKGHVDIVEMLLRNGADPKAVRNLDCSTMLHLLVMVENTEPMLPLIEKLVEIGVDVDAEDLDGNTALHLAAARGDKGCRCIALLLENGADVNVLNGKYETPFNVFIKANFDMKSARPGDYTIFYEHVQKLKVLGLLIDSRNDECYELFRNEKNTQYDAERAEQLKLAMWRKLKEKLDLLNCVLDQDESPFSLYNFLRCRIALAAEFVDCAILVELAEKDEYNLRFPNFGYLVKIKYKEAVRFNRGEMDGSEVKVGGKRKRFSLS